MRPLPQVIAAMMNVLKDEKYKNIKMRLKSVRESSLFAAPEMQPHWWNITAEILSEELGNAEISEEVKTVADIFAKKVDYNNFLN